MSNKIDTKMTSSFLWEVQKMAEEANATIDQQDKKVAELEAELSHRTAELQKLMTRLAELEELKDFYLSQARKTQAEAEWHDGSEIPEGAARVIVRSTNGATFMLEPFDKKWPKWVEKWMYIPQ